MPNLTDVLGSITETADWMKSGGILPVGRAALNAYLKRRSAEAQEILFEELRNGATCLSKWRPKTTASP